MRALVLVACGAVLTACVSRVGPAAQPSTTPAEPLTAAAAFGDFGTVDYCTLLDEEGEYRLSSFELCRTEVDFVELTVGPMAAEADAGSEHYDYPGDLPPGVRVWSYFPARGANGCVLWVGFADDVWLTVTALDAADPPWSTADSYCRRAGVVVAGVLAAIEDGRVGHAAYGPGSFGGIDPCPLITGPEFAAVGGGREPKAAPSGHACVNGRVELSFGVDRRGSGTQETVGGREATVLRDIGACHVLFQRPLADEPRFMEQARVSVPGDSSEACVLARGAAELVAPKLPR
jgi:hypothetical protein